MNFEYIVCSIFIAVSMRTLTKTLRPFGEVKLFFGKDF